MRIICLSNSSKSFKFVPGKVYEASDEGGILKILDGEGGEILAPLDGHFIQFEIVTEKKK